MKILFNIIRIISIRIPGYIVNDSQILGERRFEAKLLDYIPYITYLRLNYLRFKVADIALKMIEKQNIINAFKIFKCYLK